MAEQDYERLAQLSAKRPDEAAYADAVARQDYDIAAGTVGIWCHSCGWAPTLDQIRESLSGTGSLYYQGMEATRRLLAEHECPPELIQVPDTSEIQRMASLVGYLDPAAGRAIFENAAELAARLQQVHRDGFSQ